MWCSVQLFLASRVRAAHGDTLDDKRALRLRRRRVAVIFYDSAYWQGCFRHISYHTAELTALGSRLRRRRRRHGRAELLPAVVPFVELQPLRFVFVEPVFGMFYVTSGASANCNAAHGCVTISLQLSREHYLNTIFVLFLFIFQAP
jgi:hypothetical protein